MKEPKPVINETVGHALPSEGGTYRAESDGSITRTDKPQKQPKPKSVRAAEAAQEASEAIAAKARANGPHTSTATKS